ncbi:hypothetical protein FXF51_06525 [Nonomuraea sp. PA05]|uniref:hypothetical protein n=1 Tax=Nonomuraea sp. PA05 TaxID=2604466 RepID=UPI0011D30EC9|nr:hypothetical protein [Nonomuraea sp. PA05]TYB69814.1 hypothetical protein FXF51_06525 [Nonomuraea sp. PA05]
MRSLHWLIAGLLAVSGCAVAQGSPPAPPFCPQQWDSEKIGGWVPDAADLDGAADRLVPGAPDLALICAYPGRNTDPGGEKLDGWRTLNHQNTEAMARDLAYLPIDTANAERGCTLMGGRMTNYLVRFAYSDGGTLWLGGAEEVNSCATITNGTATSDVYLGRGLTAAFRTGTWSLPQPDDPCDESLGRRGQNEQMVPEGAVSMLVCRLTPGQKPGARSEHGAREAAALAAALNTPGTRPSTNGCQQAGPVSDSFRLVFRYGEGPAAWVHVMPDCRPGVNNGLLQAELDAPTRDQVARLAPPA